MKKEARRGIKMPSSKSIKDNLKENLSLLEDVILKELETKKG